MCFETPPPDATAIFPSCGRAGNLPLHSETRGKLDFTRFHSYQDWYEWNQVVNQAASEVCCSLKEAETQNLSLESQQNKAVCLKKISDSAGRFPPWLWMLLRRTKLTCTHNMVYKGQAISDDIKILRDEMGHLISIFQVEWDSNII